MLTPIEWWGGLIFVLGALVYKLVMGALEKKKEGIDWHRLQMHAFFLLPAVVLAGYFYPLTPRWLQYGYLGVLGAALVVALVMLVQEVTGGTGDEEGDAAGKADKTKGEGKEKEGEAEETGWLMTLLGVLVFYSPILVACGLGCAKAWPMVRQLA